MSLVGDALNIDRIMNNIGFASTDDGPYVREFRAWVAKQVTTYGMRNMGVSWGPDAGDAEERARSLLEAQWSIERGYSHLTELLDTGPITWRFSPYTKRWRVELRPDLILPWLRDKVRVLGYHYRKTRDRLRGVKNPYSI